MTRSYLLRQILKREVPPHKRRQITSILNIQEWESLGKYLGLPGSWSRSRITSLNWLKECILQKIDGWKERLLNQVGKEVLIKTVLQAIQPMQWQPLDSQKDL
ncbi:hypothetical protein SESBI_44925 [Sesbania bispinosa]|nr:hypothetical protein SESBI_44925 [Sesbania bispinosa]